jgi:hypothetical protein
VREPTANLWDGDARVKIASKPTANQSGGLAIISLFLEENRCLEV